MLGALGSTQAGAALPDSIECRQCADWNAEQAPFALTDKVFYVGTRGLSSLLIDTRAGLVLIDGGLPQTAARVEASVVKLGFKLRDVRYLLVSHEHFDRADGLAALQCKTGAPLYASFPHSQWMCGRISTHG